jgi:hypothetical protein
VAGAVLRDGLGGSAASNKAHDKQGDGHALVGV